MEAGIRAEVRVGNAQGCPIADISGSMGTPSHTVHKSVAPTDSGKVTEEFILDTGETGEGPDDFDIGQPGDDLEVRQVFSYGAKDVYRFSRSLGRGCPCESIEEYDCPLVDIHTRDGMLFLAFHAPDMPTLQKVIRTLRKRYPNTDVQRLLRTNEDRTDQDLVFVDRSSLTQRQRYVLETAHDMGYFEHPKGANAGEVAQALDITTSTFTEHLAAAQRKLLSAILEA